MHQDKLSALVHLEQGTQRWPRVKRIMSECTCIRTGIRQIMHLDGSVHQYIDGHKRDDSSRQTFLVFVHLEMINWVLCISDSWSCYYTRCIKQQIHNFSGWIVSQVDNGPIFLPVCNFYPLTLFERKTPNIQQWLTKCLDIVSQESTMEERLLCLLISNLAYYLWYLIL